MSNSPVLILVDDSAMSYVGGGTIWGGSESAHWVDNNSSFAGGAQNAGPFGSFSYTFQGTSIAFYGNTSPPDRAQTLSVRIDGDSEYQSTQPAPQEYRQWYVSPTLSDAAHTIVMNDLVSIDLDYATVTAGSSTPLKGTTLIVDDADPELVYAGKWATNTNFFTTGHGFPSGLPFQNSTHQSNTVGDSVTFQFAGTSVEVHGVFQWNATGSIAASFSVDGKPSGLTFSSSTEAPFNDEPNFEFFKATGLQPGNHTLVVNVTNAVGAQSLMLDYILYQPSFDTLASKPNFTAVATSASSAAASSATASSAAASSAAGSSSSHSNVKAIVGGVVGGLILLVLLGIGFLLWTRSRKRRATTSDNENYSSKIDAYGPNMTVNTNTTEWQERQGRASLDTSVTWPSSSVPSSTALMPSYDPSSLSSRQAYILARVEEISGLTAQLQREAAMSTDRERMAALQARIDQLTAENARLNNLPPPAYDSDHGQMVENSSEGSTVYSASSPGLTPTSSSKR
ncbi:hypothetical protein DFH09DRAFT_1390784 [Mycena vulgaris]|nr:hypothetical protein DFH09DRAFT_1390784 [Mycena vulgaris]